jgi:hypothetical protein
LAKSREIAQHVIFQWKYFSKLKKRISLRQLLRHLQKVLRSLHLRHLQRLLVLLKPQQLLKLRQLLKPPRLLKLPKLLQLLLLRMEAETTHPTRTKSRPRKRF